MNKNTTKLKFLVKKKTFSLKLLPHFKFQFMVLVKFHKHKYI